MTLVTNKLMTTRMVGSPDFMPTVTKRGQVRGFFVQDAAERVLSPHGVVVEDTIHQDYHDPSSNRPIEVRMVNKNGTIALSPSHARGSQRTADMVQVESLTRETLFLIGNTEINGLTIDFNFVLIDGKDIAKGRTYLPKREVEKLFREAEENSLKLAA